MQYNWRFIQEGEGLYPKRKERLLGNKFISMKKGDTCLGSTPPPSLPPPSPLRHTHKHSHFAPSSQPRRSFTEYEYSVMASAGIKLKSRKNEKPLSNEGASKLSHAFSNIFIMALKCHTDRSPDLYWRGKMSVRLKEASLKEYAFGKYVGHK